MSYTFYSILHVFSILVLTGVTFVMLGGASASQRKWLLSISGVAGLLALLAGVGLLHKMNWGWPVWAWIKIGCWLGLMGIGGVAMRKRHLTPLFGVCTLALLFLAVWAVYTKP